METTQTTSGKNSLQEAIRRNLLLLTGSYNVKPTKSLLVAWTVAINILTPEQIDEATVYCVRKRRSSGKNSASFMPTTPEFIEISEMLEAEKSKKLRANEEIEESNRYIEQNQEGKKKVAGMASKIGSGIGKNKVEKPKINIYEYMDQNGNLSYVAHGEVDFDFFKDQVKMFCGKYPQDMWYEHKRFEKVKRELGNGKVQVYNTFVKKDQPGPGTQAFTVGYL